jgi:hypothetical protein
MNISRFCLLLLGVLPWSLAHGELPFTFKAGDPIRASELNANFQYLESLATSTASGHHVAMRAGALVCPI